MTVSRSTTRTRSTRRAVGGRTAAITAIAAIAVAAGSAGPAQAAPPDVRVLSILPFENEALQAQRIAPYANGGAERWRVRAHFVVENKEPNTIRLTQTMIGYPGGPPAVSADVPDKNDDPKVDSRDVPPGKKRTFIVEDGMARPGGEGGDRSLFFPMPHQVQLKLKFSGLQELVTHTTRLQPYVNKTPQGSYLFPAKHTAGAHWASGIHAFTSKQKFAYDLGVRRWDKAAKKWTRLKPNTDGSNNTDYLVYGKPVHAMAPGTIVKCTWSQKDQTPNRNDGTANHFWIDHGNGEFALYAHLQEGSVNPQLCPHGSPENTYGLNIPVAAGQFLGRAGKTGTTKPHLHVHLELGANGKPFGGNAASGLPLLFHTARNVRTIKEGLIGPAPFAYNTMKGQAPAAPFNLINLSPLPFGNP